MLVPVRDGDILVRRVGVSLLMKVLVHQVVLFLC